jgi:stearoyl-CoA desaturase (delta-9 desaturase)
MSVLEPPFTQGAFRMVIPIFFVSHWILSVFMQSFFLHRYAAHKMYTVNKFWEKAFYFLTWFLQGNLS